MGALALAPGAQMRFSVRESRFLLMFAEGPIWAECLAGIALALLGLCLYAYLGYPAAARWLVRPLRPRWIPPLREHWPRISVLIAARNEVSVIRRRVENLLSQDYPEDRLEILVVSDASDDGTDEAVRAFDDPRVRLLRQATRRGKTAGINRLGRAATGEIFVQTDANVVFAPLVLQALVRAFDDPGVGVAIGEVCFTNGDDPVVASGEGLYWRYETWTKHVEASRGLLAVANGGVYALRAELWQELPESVAGDAAEPLLAACAGFRTVVAPGAVAYERAAASHREEYERKVRIIAQQVSCAAWLGLGRLPARTAWAYFSHKLLRYAVPFMAADALILGLVATLAGSRFGALAAGLVLLPLLLAPLGLISWPRPVARVFRVPLYLLVINLAAAAGVLRGLAGRAEATWEVPPSTRQ